MHTYMLELCNPPAVHLYVYLSQHLVGLQKVCSAVLCFMIASFWLGRQRLVARQGEAALPGSLEEGGRVGRDDLHLGA